VSAYEAELAAELQRVSDAQHALAVRRAHVETALRLARQGVGEGIIRATLESKQIIILCRPVPHDASNLNR